jgi:hypothetical protein
MSFDFPCNDAEMSDETMSPLWIPDSLAATGGGT